ncbi:hypothetical protein QYE76_010312 [Lolium multiflorum]|uniref:F-box domain-containing protein n=1 Tax=Lolium multiflorum TaxID=4521 RepID=A0AAD8TX16_LOLMU|nr:hypothetical protein QYE76_010312 [Lolium multiflorum]
MADATAAATAMGHASGDALATMFVPPFLPDGVVCDILIRLPATVDVYRAAAVCRGWTGWIGVTRTPDFLRSYLRPLPVPPRGPASIIAQPRRSVDAGYVHLAVISVVPGENGLPVNMPIDPKFAISATGEKTLDGDVTPLKSVADPMVEEEEEALQAELAGAAKVGVDFFQRTVPSLDLAIVASHGSLLLCRSSNSRYYICDASANRWMELPRTDPLPQAAVSHVGFKYNVINGKLSFEVVLLSSADPGHITVDSFTCNSTGAMWQRQVLHAPEAVLRLGEESPGPGVYAAGCFYWLSQSAGQVLVYNCATGLISIHPEPGMQVENITRVQASRALSYDDGKLRFWAVDLAMENGRLQARLQAWEAEGAPWPDWQFSKRILKYDVDTGEITEVARFRQPTVESRLDLAYRRISMFPLYIG